MCGQSLRIPDGEVVDACGMFGHGLGVERGSHGSLLYVIGPLADVIILNFRSMPVTLEVSA
jgi:hypothetical protein